MKIVTLNYIRRMTSEELSLEEANKRFAGKYLVVERLEDLTKEQIEQL